jgi:anti-sigma regulatory factor (Ser/Thr protein kinase)
MTAFTANLIQGPKDLRGMRHALMSWLELEHAPEDVRSAVMLATHEAAANAMVHGDPEGPVSVTASPDEGGGFVVEVTSHGGWKEPEPGHAGRGMAMMADLMSDVTIRTNVRLRSR